MNHIILSWILRILGPARLTGPIFDKELRVSSRRRRNYVLRFVYVGLFTFLLAMIWQGTVSQGTSALYQSARMAEAALAAARAANYTNAGTIEFLLDAGRDFYFLEVNARLQVEHPVTELVTGVDLVKEQLRVAAGEPLRFAAEDVRPRGAAIECRISAEDPDNNFYPATGTISRLRIPEGPGVRFDGGIAQGYEVPIYYDPLIAKLVVWAEDRPLAIERMSRALGEFVLDGVATTIPFHRWVMASDVFRKGEFDTSFVEKYFRPEASHAERQEKAAAVLCTILNHLRGPATAVSPDGAGPAANAWRLAARREGVGD